MTNFLHKHQILESLDSLDSAQTEKVLEYIKGLVTPSKEAIGNKKLKREAMKEIRQALSNNGRKLNTAF